MTHVLATATQAMAAVTSTVGASLVAAAATTAAHMLQRRDDDDDDTSTLSEINIDATFLFDWGNAPGTGPYFSANNIDAATQITSAAMMGSICLLVFSWLRYRTPELYSHRLRLRLMRPPNIPHTLFGWVYPLVTMSDRHVLETIGLDALLYFRAYRMFIYMFAWMSAFGMAVLYPVNYLWGREQPDNLPHTVFDSPLAHVADLGGRYSAAHVVGAYVFALMLFFHIDRFALHTISMRWHFLLLTRRSATARTLLVTHLPRELRSEPALHRFIAGMQIGPVGCVQLAPADGKLDDALQQRMRALVRLEQAYAKVLGNPCRARSYDPELLKRLALTDSPEARALEEQLLRRWARRSCRRTCSRRRHWPRGSANGGEDEGDGDRGSPVGRPRTMVFSGWTVRRVDAIDHWRQQLAAADRQLSQAQKQQQPDLTTGSSGRGTVAFVTMQRSIDAHILSQLSVHARPNTCKLRMAPEPRSIVWHNAGKPYSKKMLRYWAGLLMTLALLLLWCVPVVLISTLISLRFLVTRFPGLAAAVRASKFVRSLLSYTLPSLILTIFMTVLPRLLWGFVLAGGDRAFAVADKNMFIRHLYFLVIYIVIIFGMSGSVWSSVYRMFTDFGGFWKQLVRALPQMATWYCVYVMLYGAGYQVMKLLHLKSVCRYLFLQARARTPRDYMRAISPVFIDWGTFQPYTVLFFFIGILYAQLQPLLLPMTTLYYVVGLFVMKYMCVYAWYFRQQMAGSLWPMIVRRMVVCIMAYQALTTAIFASNSNHWFVAPMMVPMLFTWYYFWVRCRYLKELALSPPLQLMQEAERRRGVGLAAEKKKSEEQGGRSSASHVSLSDLTNPSIDTRSKPTPPLPPQPVSPTNSDQVLIAKPQITHHFSPPRLLAALRTALLHPIQALISTVSFSLVWLEGDPAEPLWAFIDDYAFPERVDPQATQHPAGGSSEGPNMPKEQPGSLVEIFTDAAKGLPRGLRNIAHEMFVRFEIPRAQLDCSEVTHPAAANVESADDYTAREAERRRRRKQREDSDEVGKESGDTRVVPTSMTHSTSDAASLLLDQQKSNPPPPDSAQQHSINTDFSLAPATSPTDPLPTYPPTSNLHTLQQTQSQQLQQYQQYQMHSSELPYGTQMNRKYTDFAQPNSSFAAGILDSTNFTYQHPGFHGNLPSLWLPVQQLRKRVELRKTTRQRIRQARWAVEDLVEDNILGERAAEKIHQTGMNLRQRMRKDPADTQNSSQKAEETKSSSESVPFAPAPENISLQDVHRRMDNLRVERNCSLLGIDPKVMRLWDPTGLHRGCAVPESLDSSMRDTTDGSAMAEEQAEEMLHEEESGSESDNTDGGEISLHRV
ncbi:hypothetical protein BX661DRAFT_186573 [Kickxella alabastrina]|uniref:uncharacterized protein n=1 Tax=Kickxella alabastrina TaxID=61397 RepID=UPI00221F3274|nr:uncharacterized protein BX661DRAFT_186573 [Kickxella alabastrina]KAI7823425.1 hypothetical protein BX661DRAFT_186573 [Kickxella alabastrina]